MCILGIIPDLLRILSFDRNANHFFRTQLIRQLYTLSFLSGSPLLQGQEICNLKLADLSVRQFANSSLHNVFKKKYKGHHIVRLSLLER